MNAEAYVRSIERVWAEFIGRPVIFSPKDWALVAGWHSRGIPLEIVEQAIEAAVERRTGGKPRGLSYLSAAVEEGWSVVREARRPEPKVPQATSPRQRWIERVAAEPDGSPLGELLEELLARAAAGEDPVKLDLELDTRLPGAVPESLGGAVGEEIIEEVEPFRARMGEAQFASTIERATVQRLRTRLNLPRLAGSGSAS